MRNNSIPQQPDRSTSTSSTAKLIDLTGKRFGRWTVLAIHQKRMRYGRHGQAVLALWLCRCDCGTERVVFGTNLRRGLSASCGCLKREQAIKLFTKHGHARKGRVTRAYTCWVSMLQRCFNPNNKCYYCYGGRGIGVCERWLKFENFYADVGDPPPGKSLDRINVNGDYAPDNCRWATATEQTHNRRKRKRRRAKLEDILKYTDALARAATPPAERGTP